MNQPDLEKLSSPILLKGTAQTAFRDPAAVYHNGMFYLFYTYVVTEGEDVYLHLALSVSRDLIDWTPPRILTPRDKSLNYSSPGNVIRWRNQWLICFQTYCREHGEKYGNGNSRVYFALSDDLEHWGPPRLMRVKGDVPFDAMGRMIDPCLVEDPEIPGRWWCFYKQNGVSMSYTDNFEHFTYAGHTDCGENVCILRRGEGYRLFHSPPNGIGVMESAGLRHWESRPGLITLGQRDWDWAKGRLTAAFVLDCRKTKGVEKYLMFFHGTGPENEDVIFDQYACIGLAWSSDLETWSWPGKNNPVF